MNERPMTLSEAYTLLKKKFPPIEVRDQVMEYSLEFVFTATNIGNIDNMIAVSKVCPAVYAFTRFTQKPSKTHSLSREGVAG